MSASPVASSATQEAPLSPLAFTPITTRDVSEQVILELVNSIRRTELEPGDRLPNLPELAAELGVARDNARRALHALAREGVVEIRPGRYGGTVMRERSGIPRALERVLGPSLMTAGAWEHLIEARRLLQPAASKMLIRGGDPRAMARLERYLDDMRRHVADNAYADALYDGIELACATAVHCGNPVIGEMLLRVMDRLSVLGVMMRIDRETSVAVVEGSLDAQERLIEAMRTGDEAGIDDALTEQLELTTQVIRDMRLSA